MTLSISSLPTHAAWHKIGTAPHHGIALALSSIRTQNSCGIGEFLDVFLLIDWCKTVGFDIIQFLPLNDSGNDASPYNTLSSCALNPLFLSLRSLPYLEQERELVQTLDTIASFNHTPRVSYTDVKGHKMHWLRQYYKQTAARFAEERGLQDFIKNNPWVETYALFKLLKEQLEYTPWHAWPPELKTPTLAHFRTLLEQHHKELLFYIVLQYLCFLQLQQVKAYANAKGVFLKGDIPILISRDSADVWSRPEFFDLSYSAGTPPDMYNQEGQYWGFPLFNWERLRQEGNGWWKQRVRYAANFYNLYRIDHVLGFFRIWAIPLDRPAKEGFFIPKDRATWVPHGTDLLLMLINASSMLPIAEDLGVVYPEVRIALQTLGICGTKVVRWERNWDTDKTFIPFSSYSPLSMTCISTHDSETLQQWWKDDPDESQVFAAFKGWVYTPHLTSAQREIILRDCHHTPSLFHINLLQEYLALFPELVSSNIDDERINIPGKILPTNWTYRFLPSLEELISHQPLQSAIKRILHD